MIQMLDNRELAAWNEIYNRFVVDIPFKAHRSRLLPGQHRLITEANKQKLRVSMLSLSRNPSSPIGNLENLLTGYLFKEAAYVMPQSWINSGTLTSPFF